MAKEIMLDDGRTALFDDDATEADIDSKLKSQNLKRRTGPVQPAQNVNVPGGPVLPFAASAVNSLAFGIPEMAARALGAGPYIEGVRQEYPMATTAGDIAGMLPPFKMAAKLGERAVGSMFKPKNTVQDTFDALRRTDVENRAAQEAAAAAAKTQPISGIPGFTQTLAKKVGGYGTGVIGAQTQAAALGAARSPDQPMAGAQQGAQTFRQVATNLPVQMIPGAQTSLNALTSVVPAALGYGAAMTDYLSIDEMMRQEAARRAMQGSQ